MEIGLTTFVETTPDVKTGKTISHAERIREVIEEIVLADEVGLMSMELGSIIEKTMHALLRLSYLQQLLHVQKHSIIECCYCFVL